MSYESFGAISFSGNTKIGPFYTLILNGHKRQTIREPRIDGRPHVKPGYTFKLYWMMRVPKRLKPIHLIGVALCKEYETVYLRDMWNDESNALLDGFIDLDEFRDWFFEGWRDVHLLDKIIETYNNLKKADLSTDILTNWTRRTGKGVIVDFLTREYRRIKWAYPLVEIA